MTAAPLAVDLTTAFVSVVVPHYRDLRALDLCLDSLARQTLPGNRFEVIVADNNSPEGAAVVEHAIAGRARLVIVNERGAGPARNGGVAVATGNVLAFIDSDCVCSHQLACRRSGRPSRLRFYRRFGSRSGRGREQDDAFRSVRTGLRLRLQELHPGEGVHRLGQSVLPPRPCSITSADFEWGCRKTWSGRTAPEAWGTAWATRRRLSLAIRRDRPGPS